MVVTVSCLVVDFVDEPKAPQWRRCCDQLACFRVGQKQEVMQPYPGTKTHSVSSL